jgi:hypothetical protein
MAYPKPEAEVINSTRSPAGCGEYRGLGDQYGLGEHDPPTPLTAARHEARRIAVNFGKLPKLLLRTEL